MDRDLPGYNRGWEAGAYSFAGHFLGGTFAAICAALHPESVKGLVLLGAPLHFGEDAGAFWPLVSAAPRAHIVASMLGNLPGRFWIWADWLASLPDPQLHDLHSRVLRWSLDEVALPRQLF